MALQEKKIMPPPWLAHREIERYSIGWRMGYGEDYIYRFGDWLDTLSPDEQTEYRTLFPEPVMAVAKYWFEQHGAVPAAMSHDELEFLLPAPVPEEKAMDAAVELYGFCPDVIDQGPEDATVGALADVLRQSTVWYFWWD